MLAVSPRLKMQIGSLRQLTIISFLIALVPLAVLLWQSQSSLTKLAQIAASEAQFSVDMARQIGDMENIAVDVERLTRQYHVLQKQELKDLALNYIERLHEKLTSVCTEMSEKQVCQSLQNRIQWFKDNASVQDELLLDAQLAEFRRSISELLQQIDGLLDCRIAQQKQFVGSVQQSQA